MSLDVYLEVPTPIARPASGIFVRENGSTRQLSREEWGASYPDRRAVMGEWPETSTTAYEANITHNLGPMAHLAGIYDHLWRPDELGVTEASQLIEPLRTGLKWLNENREAAEKLNPSNGWGDYLGLVLFVTNYLEACEHFPDANVRVSR